MSFQVDVGCEFFGEAGRIVDREIQVPAAGRGDDLVRWRQVAVNGFDDAQRFVALLLAAGVDVDDECLVVDRDADIEVRLVAEDGIGPEPDNFVWIAGRNLTPVAVDRRRLAVDGERKDGKAVGREVKRGFEFGHEPSLPSADTPVRIRVAA